MKRIAVYCGSATPADPVYIETAKAVGATLAARGIGVVYGGGRLGLMGAVADAALEAGGEVIGKKQLVQQMIASMVAGRDIGRLLYYQVGWMKNQGHRHTRECSMAKWANCYNAFDAATKAVEIHGGYGFCDEFPVERYFRNSRGAMIYEGTHEIHTIMQAEYELGYRSDKPIARVLPTYPFEV